MDEYRCPYCGCPLDDADATRDGEALYCAECDERVEFFNALEEAERRDNARTICDKILGRLHLALKIQGAPKGAPKEAQEQAEVRLKWG